MRELLDRCELFAGLDPDDVSELARAAQSKSLESGQYLFLLGDPADRLYVVSAGAIETCFPIFIQGEMRDLAVEAKKPGEALGWSAFVRPHRFTLSARAREQSEVVALPRVEIDRVTEARPRLGCQLTARISELLGRRLLTIQALWARELQRALDQGWSVASAVPPAGEDQG